VLDDDQLGPETRLVYVMLRRLAATTRARSIDQRQFAHRIGIPAYRIPRHLTLLQRRGLIRIHGRLSTRGPIRYSLQGPAVYDGDAFARPPAMQPRSRSSRQIRGAAGLSLADRLIIVGVDPKVAERLITRYPRERVAEALRAAHQRRPRPRDPAAWIVAAIRHGWVTPSAAVAVRQQQAAQEAAIVAWERRADDALTRLPAQTRESLHRQASEIVEHRFNTRVAASTIGTMMITVEVRRLVAERIGIPVPEVAG
jgi:hypothetical protein